MSSNNKPKIPASTLHELLTSTVKRQHMLANVPPALRFMPLGALAVGKALEKNFNLDKDIVEDVLMEGGQTDAKHWLLPSEVEVMREIKEPMGEKPKRMWSCGVCNPPVQQEKMAGDSNQELASQSQNLHLMRIVPFLPGPVDDCLR